MDQRLKQQQRYNLGGNSSLPDAALKLFKSSAGVKSEYVLFCCLFNPDPSHGNLLAICDEEGYLSVLNTAGTIKPQDCWRAHTNALFDISWITGRPEQLVTAAADNSAVLWDVTRKQKLETFHGHNGSLRSVSSSPENPHVFVTGGRDGAVMVYDTRNRTKDSRGGILPVNKIYDAHKDGSDNITKGKSPKIHKTAKGKKSMGQTNACSADAKVTGVLFHSDDGIFSISDNCSSGVRYWDLRKTYCALKSAPTPKRILFHPKLGIKRLGYAALCTDRYRSRLFVACTDHLIYEYDALPGSGSGVVESYEGARFESYYVNICCSPHEDYLLGGSSSGEGLIWDVAKSRRSHDGLRETGKPPNLPYPRFQMNGHATEITGVSWSNSMDAIATCEDRYWRIWTLHGRGSLKRPDNGMIVQEEVASIGDFSLPASTKASKQLEHLIVSPVKRSPAIHIMQDRSANITTPPGSPVNSSFLPNAENYPPQRQQKRKLAFSSPFKSSSSHRSPIRSPKKKISRLSKFRDRHNDEKTKDVAQPNKNFHAQTPTQNLPNFMLDRTKHPTYKSPNKTKKSRKVFVVKPTLTNFDLAPTPLQRPTAIGICVPVIKSPASKAIKKITLRQEAKLLKGKENTVNRRSSRRSILDYFKKT